MNLEEQLRKSKNEWQYKVYQLINEVPPGHVITYGGLAKRANRKYGLNINARNVANLRRRLYGLLTHDTEVPLHRMAKAGDALSQFDSPETQKYNQRLRTPEGSWPEPKWLYE